MKQVQIIALLVAMLFQDRQTVAYILTNKKICRLPTTSKDPTRQFLSSQSFSSLKGEPSSASSDGATRKSLGTKLVRGSSASSTEKAAATKKVKKGLAATKKKKTRGSSKAKTIIKEPGSKKDARKKGKRKAQKDYWSEDGDEAILEFKQSHGGEINTPRRRQVSKVHFKIRGNPRPLRRHRTSRGIMYNPSEKLQNKFRETVQKLVFLDDDTIPQPLFEQDQILVISMVFRLRRARHNFIGNKAGPGRMRDTAPHATSQTRTDVDNLVKFVLDAMNLVLYEDDRQITSIHVTKVLDDEGLCEGSTEVLLRSIGKEEVEGLISQSLLQID